MHMKVNRRAELFPDVTDEDWYNWKWQVRNRIENVDDLNKLIPLSKEEEEGAKNCLKQFRMAITPYYLSLIDPNDPYDPIRAQSIPTADELLRDEVDLIEYYDFNASWKRWKRLCKNCDEYGFFRKRTKTLKVFYVLPSLYTTKIYGAS